MRRTFSALRLHALLAGLTLPLHLTGCPTPPGEAEPSTSQAGGGWSGIAPAGTIANVNGHFLSQARFDAELQRAQTRFAQSGQAVSPELEARLRAHTLRRLIDELLLEQKARAEGIALSEGDVDAMVQARKSRFASEEAYRQALSRAGQTPDDVRRELRVDTLRERIAERAMLTRRPSEDEARRYYERHPERFVAPIERRVRQVLWSPPAPASAAGVWPAPALRAEAEALARAWRAHPDEGERVLDRIPATTPRGVFRDLAWIVPAQLPMVLEEAVFRSDVGQVVGPVESELGLHVLHIQEARGGQTLAFESVRDRILSILEGRLRTRVVRELVADLRSQAVIEVYADIDWQRARGSGQGTFGEPSLTRAPTLPPSTGGSAATPPSPLGGVDAGPGAPRRIVLDRDGLPRAAPDAVEAATMRAATGADADAFPTGVRDVREPSDGSKTSPEVIAR